ncbi:tail fiber protein [Azospirillum doebereinerae]|uniref:Phage tail collar domain-containing protein n=1 Tax=Azospirillum doebereinerae TaxID=92933 RepID=A0A433J1X8_9PROT|nr:tail fiber protein [Azospirillum doebereinerae]RUQ65100.1 hypothetical protein EJ913_25475 [Azospirillum doebereinerae]
MSHPWYRAGTVAVVNGSDAVVGDGTLWTSQTQAGDIFTVDRDQLYMVVHVADNTHLTIWPTYAGTDHTAAAYAIINQFNSTTQGDLAKRLADLIRQWQIREDQYGRWVGGGSTGGSGADGTGTGGYYPLTDANGVVRYVRSPQALLDFVGDGVVRTAEEIVALLTDDVDRAEGYADTAQAALDGMTALAETTRQNIDAAATLVVTATAQANHAIAAASDAATSATGIASVLDSVTGLKTEVTVLRDTTLVAQADVTAKQAQTAASQTAAAAALTAAETARALARDWAAKTGSPVDGVEVSAKQHALNAAQSESATALLHDATEAKRQAVSALAGTVAGYANTVTLAQGDVAAKQTQVAAAAATVASDKALVAIDRGVVAEDRASVTAAAAAVAGNKTAVDAARTAVDTVKTAVDAAKSAVETARTAADLALSGAQLAQSNAASSATEAAQSATAAAAQAGIATEKATATTAAATNATEKAAIATTAAATAAAAQAEVAANAAAAAAAVSTVTNAATTASTAATTATDKAAIAASAAATATTKAASADSASVNSANSAQAAAGAATDAINAKTDTVNARDLTAGYRDAALTHMNKAQGWAETARGTEVEPGLYSAKNYALEAKDLRDQAATIVGGNSFGLIGDGTSMRITAAAPASIVNLVGAQGTGLDYNSASQTVTFRTVATGVPVTPAGNLTETTLQATLYQLDTLKADKATTYTRTEVDTALSGLSPNEIRQSGGAVTIDSLGAVVIAPAAGQSATVNGSPIVTAADVPLIPAGQILEFAGTTLPPRALWCDGALHTVAAYPELFAAIGYAYGGSGEVFAVPDLRGRVPMGAGHGPGLTERLLGTTGGVEGTTLTPAQLAAHSHGLTSVPVTGTVTVKPFTDAFTGGVNLPTTTNYIAGRDSAASANFYQPTQGTRVGPSDATVDLHASGTTSATAAPTDPVPVVQPFLAVNYIITTGAGIAHTGSPDDLAVVAVSGSYNDLDNKPDLSDVLRTGDIGGSDGLLPLVDGKIAAMYLPSYVDDVIEVASFAALPVAGEGGKIYVLLDGGPGGSKPQYRWSGSEYIAIVSSPGSTDAVPEGTANLYFTDARASAAVASALSGKQASDATLTALSGRTIGYSAATDIPAKSDVASAINSAIAASNPAWSSIASKPTTIAGYGITDALTANGNHSDPSGFAAGGASSVHYGWNVRLDNGVWKTINTGVSAYMRQDNDSGKIVLAVAPSATAGSIPSFTNAYDVTYSTKVVDFKATPTVNGSAIWHAGNFTPASKLDTTATAAASTKLSTARTINGVSFDGSANISVPASSTPFTATGNIAATNVQAALVELDSEKASTAVATASANGLMSSADKTKLDGLGSGKMEATYTAGAAVAANTFVTLDSNGNVVPITGRMTSIVSSMDIYAGNVTFLCQTQYMDATQILIVYHETASNRTVVQALDMNWSGGFSKGASVVLDPGGLISDIDIAFDGTTFVVAYRDRTTGQGIAVAGTVSGTTITLGTPAVFRASSVFYVNIEFAPDTVPFAICYSDVANGNKGYVVAPTVSGLTLSYGTAVQFSNTAVRRLKMIATPGQMAYVMVYCDQGNSNYGTITVVSVSQSGVFSPKTPVVFDSSDFSSRTALLTYTGINPTLVHICYNGYGLDGDIIYTTTVKISTGYPVSIFSTTKCLTNTSISSYPTFITCDKANYPSLYLLTYSSIVSGMCLREMNFDITNHSFSLRPIQKVPLFAKSSSETFSFSFQPYVRKLFCLYRNQNTNSLAIASLPSNPSTANAWIGLAKSTANAGQSVTVVLPGGIADTGYGYIGLGGNTYIDDTGNVAYYGSGVCVGVPLQSGTLLLSK